MIVPPERGMGHRHTLAVFLVGDGQIRKRDRPRQ